MLLTFLKQSNYEIWNLSSFESSIQQFSIQILFYQLFHSPVNPLEKVTATIKKMNPPSCSTLEIRGETILSYRSEITSPKEFLRFEFYPNEIHLFE